MARDKNLRPCLPLKPQEKVEDKIYLINYLQINYYRLLERRLDDQWRLKVKKQGLFRL